MTGVAELQITLTFRVVYCCRKECGTPIAMPRQIYESFLADRTQYFHCCFGHPQHFTGPTEAEKLKGQLEIKERSLEWGRARVKRAEKQVSVFKGKVTRIKNRVGNGVCPCCNRTFQNLMAHMQTKHPGYSKEEA